MKRHYTGLTERMLSKIESISNQMSNPGEKGRNNEAILCKYLEQNLPKRYTVSTGKVVGVGGTESGQMDIIIHDRLTCPAFIDADEWSLVPIETVQAIISVKTTLNKKELRHAMESIESVRKLPRQAATTQVGDKFLLVPEDKVLKPRALVFGYKSSWRSVDGLRNAFEDLLHEFDDSNRPNGVLALDQAFVFRRPFTENMVTYDEHTLLHFFVFLVMNIDNRPTHGVDLTKYFTEDYGVSGA